MKKSKKINKEQDKVFKVLKIICLIGVGIVLIEFIIFGILVLTNNKDVNIDLSQKIINIDDGYAISGSSNFKNKDDREIGKVGIYKDGKLVKEFKYDKYYRSVFYDIQKVNDGYIAVGATQKTIKKYKKGLKDALIVKFSNDGKVIWDNVYNELDDAYFRNLIIDNDSIVVVGSSIYASDVIGNEKKGGAIIVKYDLSNGKVIANNHFGGNKVGAFNDIIKVDNYYYAVGNDISNMALIIKMDSNLQKVSVANYKNTNKVGFTSLVNANNSLYVTFSKTKGVKEQAAIVRYDYELKKQKETLFEKDDYSIWNEIIDYKGNLYLVGDGAKKEKKKNSLFVKYLYKGIVSKYSYDLKMDFNKEFEYENNDFYKSLIIREDTIYVVGFTNSKIKNLGSSKYNYVSFIHKYDLDEKKEQ